MKKKSVLRKVLAVSLAVAMMFGTGFTATGRFVGTSVLVSAAQVYGDFQYSVNDDNTITITKYTGSGGKVTIPSKIGGKSVTSIGDRVFYACEGLRSITISDSVTSIGDYAFYNCKNLESIIIGNSVTYIGELVFSLCKKLASITVSEKNTAYSSDNGVLFNKNKTKMIIYPKGKKGGYAIPDSVTSIGESAFSGCIDLTSITIPDSVTSIGKYAFCECARLKNVTIPDSVTEIGSSTFHGCTGLTNITIPDSVTYIGESAFWDCTGLTSITIPNSVTFIAWETFYNCKRLTSVTIENGVKAIDSRAFDECIGLKSITIPDSITFIGNNAFDDCTGLTSITIPDSVTTIGDYAFMGCTGLESINVSEKNTAYSSDHGVLLDKYKTEVIICPEGKKGGYVVPDSVTSIYYCAFRDCTGLTSVKIPDKVTDIGAWSFYGCTALTNITIPDGVKNIGRHTFSYCESLTSIAIPGSVKYIDHDAFDYCTGLTSVIIENGVTSIGDRAFSGCTNLKSITIPASVTDIGYWGVFSDCTSLENINVDKNNTKYSSEDGVLFDKAKTELIEYTIGKKGTYTIPDSVTSIGRCAFDGCTGLTSIMIPDSVTEIGEYAFCDCKSLTNITVPDSVTSIGECALGYYFNENYEEDYYLNGDDEIYYHKHIDNFTIYGKKSSCAETYAKENDIPFVAVTLNKSTVSAKEIVLGQTVTVNAKASEDNCTYAVQYKKRADTKWITQQYYSTNDTITIKPAQATDYDVCVKVKDSAGKIVKKYFEVKVNAKLANTSTISATTIKKGETVTLNGSATGGMGGYTYAVLYKKKSDTKWTIKQNYSTNDTIAVKPAKATTYDVCIKAQDKAGTIVKKFFEVTVEDNALKNTSTISATTIKKGDTVTLNGSATGGMGGYTYAVLYKKKAETKWTVIQNYNTNSEILVRPYTNTDYDICIKVKDKDGTIVKKYFTVTVTK